MKQRDYFVQFSTSSPVFHDIHRKIIKRGKICLKQAVPEQASFEIIFKEQKEERE